jgi:hypothetical protein
MKNAISAVTGKIMLVTTPASAEKESQGRCDSFIGEGGR